MINEEQVWETITNSAISKFDAQQVRNKIVGINDLQFDNVIFDALTRMLVKQSESQIVDGLNDAALDLSIKWDKNDIQEFVSGKNELWSKEVMAMERAFENLNEDETLNDYDTILRDVKVILGNN